jgi:two-component system KDP operon response regulator KdpE/two-component system response regulator VicR
LEEVKVGQSRILIIDDDQFSNEFIRSHLEARDYKVLLAISGKEAIKIIEKELPDLILMNISLPHADSFRICRKVREWSEIPIVIMSDRNNELNEMKCLDTGVDGFVIKPFSLEILVLRVKAVLRRAETNSMNTKDNSSSTYEFAGSK